MTKHKKIATMVFGSTFLVLFMVPALAFAQEAATTAAADGWQLGAAKAIGAALAMGLAAVGAGYAQGNIGSAGAGTLAERPELLVQVIMLMALPEIIVLLGFVSMIMLKP